MSVPETPMNQNYFSSRRKDYVRFSRQILLVEFVPVAVTVQQSSDYHFWLSIFLADSAHVYAPLLWSESVCHISVFESSNR